jgi:hypothetical protein
MTQFSRGLPGYSNEGATSSLGEILGIAMEEGLAVEAMGEALKQLQDEAAEDETEEDDIEQGSDEGKAELNSPEEGTDEDTTAEPVQPDHDGSSRTAGVREGIGRPQWNLLLRGPRRGCPGNQKHGADEVARFTGC